MQATKVGIREFREKLSIYLESKTPVAITRHGTTIGVFVPTKPKASESDREAFRIASEKMQGLVASSGSTEDVLIEDFKQLRRSRRSTRG